MNYFYTHGVNELTLEDALRKHYLLNPQFTVWSQYKSETARKLVKAHDISHIIFGCDTSLLGEMRVQLWAKFGVQSFGLKESLSYAKDKEAKVLLKNPVGYWAMFIFFLKNFDEIFKIRLQSKSMTKKWMYFNEHAHMETTVQEIRNEFHIQVFVA